MSASNFAANLAKTTLKTYKMFRQALVRMIEIEPIHGLKSVKESKCCGRLSNQQAEQEL